MKILWLTWKDMEHPEAGGAELVNEELAKRLVRDGHKVIFLVGGFVETRRGASVRGASTQKRDGVQTIRFGNRFTVYYHVWQYYRNNLADWADLVIDEINTVPFFAKFYVETRHGASVRQRDILFIHQLAREIWFYQMFFPLNIIGYLIEPLYLWLLRDRKVVTVSYSTKQDLIANGFKKENIDIISEGIKIKPVQEPGSYRTIKYEKPTILSFGAVRPMKRTMDIVEAFEIAKGNIPDLQLKIAGDASGKYGNKVKKYIKKSKYKDSIDLMGRVSEEEKINLMQKSHLIAVTSIREGWGLVVTEANSQGTPAVVYDVAGLRDSVRNNVTGLICRYNKPDDMAASIIEMLGNMENYEKLRRNAWEWSKEITFLKSYKDFKKIIFSI